MSSEKLFIEALVATGVVNDDAIDDAKWFDDGLTLERIKLAYARFIRAPAQDSGELPNCGFDFRTGQDLVFRGDAVAYGEKKRQEGIAQERAKFGDEDKRFVEREALLMKRVRELESAPAVPGFAEKFFAWFNTPNPLLGDVAPLEMLKLGRGERLGKFIEGANRDLLAAAPQPPTSNSVEFDGIKKPRPQVELTDAELVELAVADEFLLYCSEEEFVEIAKAAIAADRAKNGRA